jgi:drug/metabolite transporter (DMT)-like permease
MTARGRATAYGFALLSVMLGSLGQVLLRLGARGGPAQATLAETLTRALSSPVVWAGLCAYALSSLLWLVALSRLDLSAAYPLGASGYVVVAFASLAMGEVVTPLRWMGVAVIIAGILLVSLGGRPVTAAQGAR